MNATQQIITDLGLRATPSRLAVLELLNGADNALSHQELLNQLNARHTGSEEFDRVTLYRGLDWLVANGIIHKVTGQDRAWRFQLNRANAMHRHAHFQCTHCGKTYCLSEVHPQKPPSLPAHFTVESVELNIKGVCAGCRDSVITAVN